MSNVFVELADKLGILSTIKETLFEGGKGDPERFARALDEIAELFDEIDRVLVGFLTISFKAPDDAIRSARARLLELEGGKKAMSVATMKKSCNTLRSIYGRSLEPWLTGRLTSAELRKVREAFQFLESFHTETLQDVRELFVWLSKSSSHALEALDAGDIEGAEKVIKKARKEVFPRRQAIGNAVTALLELKGEIILATRER